VTSSKPLDFARGGLLDAARGRNWLAGLAIAALVAAIVGVQIVRDRRYPQSTVSERMLYVRSGEAMTRIALSFDALAADLYWIRTIQHYGGDRLSNLTVRYDLLYPLLDLTTTLDPWFRIAYRFGAIFLAEEYPGGAGRTDLAIRLLQKGIRHDPRWQYYHDIGFVHYFHTGNFIEAAHWFQRAAQVPGAPNWLKPLAATTLAQGGQRGAARFLWRQLHDTAENEWMRSAAARRLVQLDALDQIDRLEAIIAWFAPREPDGPLTWERLIRAGVFRGVPRDPAGASYELNPWWGLVSVSPSSPLYPMPAEPLPAAAAVKPPGDRGPRTDQR
jgi:hypothetical protein